MTDTPRIRVVLLLEDLEFGGTQRHALQLLEGLDRHRFAPELWVLRGGDDFTASAKATGVPVTRLSTGRWVGPLALLRLGLNLWRERPDVLYTLTALPNIWGRPLAALQGIPVVSGFRGSGTRQHERLLHRFSARILANAACLRKQLIEEFGVEPDRVTVIPNGVDGEHFTPDEAARSSHPLVVCVARLVGPKDIPTLLEAFRMTCREIPDARLEIIGRGRAPEAVPPNVKFLPGTSEIRAHLRRAWIFALSSRHEGMPNAVLEAMGCALPVVATRVDGFPEVVEDEKTGLLVPPGDSAALAAAMTRLFRDPTARRAMGDAGRRRVLTHFGLQRMVRETEKVLLQVAQRGTTWTTTEEGELPLELPLWPASGVEAPVDKIIERGKFRPDRSVRAVGVPTLAVFLPRLPQPTGVGVILCPGGAYAGITIDREGFEVARWLTAQGITALVLKYRLPRAGMRGGHPWPLQDVARAVELAREHAPAWHIDADRIGVMGFSVGGHMAAYASGAVPGVAFSVLVYPLISMDAQLTHGGSRKRLLGSRPDAELTSRYSMERHVTPETSPCLLVHARDDDVVSVRNSELFAEALREAGVSHECRFFASGGHGFGLGRPGDVTEAWPDHFTAWLRKQGILATPRA